MPFYKVIDTDSGQGNKAFWNAVETLKGKAQDLVEYLDPRTPIRLDEVGSDLSPLALRQAVELAIIESQESLKHD